MNIVGSIGLVTGANRGIGRAFVNALLERGAAKVYITGRDMGALQNMAKANSRLVPLELDVTDTIHVSRTAISAPDINLLINNAGYMAFKGAIAAPDMTAARQEMEINYFGPLALTRALAPVLARSGGGTIVNILSMAALVSLPVTGTYSASKAAILSLTRSMRAELAAQGTTVIGVLAVQTETALGAPMPPPRMAPEEVVADVLTAVEAGLSEEVAAGALTRAAYQAFTADPVAFQAKMSSRLPPSA